MLKVSSVTKRYGDDTVLDGIDIVFDRSKAHGLLGANGAGKSTLIKLIMHLVFENSGHISRPEEVCFLPENPYLPSNLTAFQIVSHACSIQKKTGIVEKLLDEVRLKKDAWNKSIHTYSKGMKQRTAIACALAGKPEWLILDEPMSGLDAMGRRQMLDVFEKRKDSNMSLLMCSHSVTDLVRLCQIVHIMSDGKVCESVEIKENSMKEAEALEERLKFWSAGHALD